MARGMAVSSYPVPSQLAHKLRSRLIANPEIQRLLHVQGCAPLAAHRLGVAQSSVANALAGRSDSYFIIRELYAMLLTLPSANDPGIRAYVETTAPPSVVSGLEELAVRESELLTTKLLLEVQGLLLSRLPAEQQTLEYVARADQVMADYRSLSDGSDG